MNVEQVRSEIDKILEQSNIPINTELAFALILTAINILKSKGYPDATIISHIKDMF